MNTEMPEKLWIKRGDANHGAEVWLHEAINSAEYQRAPVWQPIETAPKDGTVFEALIDGLPYKAKYDEFDRFIFCMHSNLANGAAYKIHNIDGKRLLEEIRPTGYDYQKSWTIWKKGFDHEATHWRHEQPLPTEEKTT